MIFLDITNLNAKDLYSLFNTLYKEKHGVEYKGVGFIGNEMKKMREVVDEHGSGNVACAISNCIRNNDRTVNVPYFTTGIKYYLIPYNPEIYWFVKYYGNPKMKKLFREYMFLDSTWLPSASKRTKRKEILQVLKEWVNNEKRKRVTKTAKK
jgi:hypothetical protein